MRVLQLGPYPPPHGGIQTNLVAIRRLLRERGHWCGVVNITRHRSALDDCVYHPRTALETVGLLVRLRFDVVHFHVGGDLSPRLLALALLCCLMPRARAVLSFHSGGYPSSKAGRTARPRSIRGFIFRRFDRILAVNAEIAEMFRRFGVSAERIRVIPPHAAPVVGDTPLPALLRQFFDRHDPVFLAVGLLEPEYDLHLQIKVLGTIRARYPDAGLVIAGSGKLYHDLRRYISLTNYAEHVFLYGDMPHPVTLRAISECDILLRTTVYDGDSVAVREALGLGTPVIATDNSMRPSGVCLVPACDEIALQAAIEQTLAAPPPSGSEWQSEASDNIESILELYGELLTPPALVPSTDRMAATRE